MIQYTQYQILLLKWFKHYNKRSLDQIRNACKNLLISFNIDTKNALFKVFYPLVRKGYVDFIGEGVYQISKPIILFYPSKRDSIAINFDDGQKLKLTSRFKNISIDDFDLHHFKSTKIDLIKFCKDINCQYQEVNTLRALSNFPKISHVIANYDRSTLNSNGEYFDLMKHKWKGKKGYNLGLFRHDKASLNVFLRTKRYGDLSISSANFNPEARPLAEVFQAGIEGINYLFYNSNKKELVIKSMNIPILIERILRSAVLYSSDGVIEKSEQLIFNYIPISIVKQLNRILGTKAIIK